MISMVLINTLTSWITKICSNQMVKTCPIVEWSRFQMSSEYDTLCSIFNGWTIQIWFQMITQNHFIIGQLWNIRPNYKTKVGIQIQNNSFVVLKSNYGKKVRIYLHEHLAISYLATMPKGIAMPANFIMHLAWTFLISRCQLIICHLM